MEEAATSIVEASRSLRGFSSSLLRLQPPMDDASLSIRPQDSHRRSSARASSCVRGRFAFRM
jgi:hypothetical protein